MNIQYVVVVGFDMKPLITPTYQHFSITEKVEIFVLNPKCKNPLITFLSNIVY